MVDDSLRDSRDLRIRFIHRSEAETTYCQTVKLSRMAQAKFRSFAKE